MLLQISGPGLIHFMIRCIKAEAFRRGFQKSTAVVPFSQGFVFFSIISSRLSQQYVQMQGGPIICTIQACSLHRRLQAGRPFVQQAAHTVDTIFCIQKYLCQVQLQQP